MAHAAGSERSSAARAAASFAPGAPGAPRETASAAASVRIGRKRLPPANTLYRIASLTISGHAGGTGRYRSSAPSTRARASERKAGSVAAAVTAGVNSTIAVVASRECRGGRPEVAPFAQDFDAPLGSSCAWQGRQLRPARERLGSLEGGSPSRRFFTRLSSAMAASKSDGRIGTVAAPPFVFDTLFLFRRGSSPDGVAAHPGGPERTGAIRVPADRLRAKPASGLSASRRLATTERRAGRAPAIWRRQPAAAAASGACEPRAPPQVERVELLPDCLHGVPVMPL